jgi:hypothetical protein
MKSKLATRAAVVIGPALLLIFINVTIRVEAQESPLNRTVLPIRSQSIHQYENSMLGMRRRHRALK